jgi:hypothetical protein
MNLSNIGVSLEELKKTGISVILIEVRTENLSNTVWSAIAPTTCSVGLYTQ